MKKNLLLLFLLFCGSILMAQNSNNQQLALLDKTTKSKGELKIFPNPATNFISVSENDQVKQILVFNLVGRKMKTFKAIKGEKHFVGDLPKGIYLIQLLGDKNKILRTQRVSKR